MVKLEKIEEVRFPMSSHKNNMQDKHCDYKTLAIMTLYSNITPMKDQHETGIYEDYRFLYKNRIIKFTEEIEYISNNKINTIIKNMRKLSQLDGDLVTAYKNKNEEIYYAINYGSGVKNNKFVTIPGEMLKYLIWTGNSNVIKAYILIKYLCEYEESEYGNKEKKITNSYICEQIGLNPNSKNNLHGVKMITESLQNNGFINRREVTKGEGIKKYIYYSVNGYEEWKNRNKN